MIASKFLIAVCFAVGGKYLSAYCLPSSSPSAPVVASMQRLKRSCCFSTPVSALVSSNASSSNALGNVGAASWSRWYVK